MSAAPPNSAAPALETPVLGLAPRTRQILSDYVELTKPKVQSLLIFTTITTMEIAGSPSVSRIALTCAGGYLSAGGGEEVNHSSVFARHGSGPATTPFLRLRATLTTVTRTPAARMNDPIVEIKL